MNLPFFLSRKTSLETKSFSGFITRIAITAVALSVCIMIIGSAVTQGYQQEISAKFFDCWGHIHLTTFIPDPGNILSDEKVSYDGQFIEELHKNPNIRSVRTYRVQSAIVKAEDEMEGVILKGIHFKEGYGGLTNYIQQGRKESSYTGGYDSVLISSTLADKMNLKLQDKLLIYVVDKNDFKPRARRVYVSGIYSTGLEDFDKLFVVCDNRLIQQINHDDPSIIQGYEINLHNADNLGQTQSELSAIEGSHLHSYSIKERFPGVFSWLRMMQTNEGIIIIIMMIIAFINMTTALLILILERTAMVGVLKSIGMPNHKISRIFIYSGSYIVILGTLIGSLTAMIICFVQQQFHLIRLDESSYFIRYIPIYFNWMHLSGIIFSTIIFCTLIMSIPALLVRKIIPVKALRFQ